MAEGGVWFVFVGNQVQIPYENNLFELAIFWSFFDGDGGRGCMIFAKKRWGGITLFSEFQAY